MSETLIGVIIGGLLGIISSWLLQHYQLKRWKSEQKLKYLREKRSQLKEHFEKALFEINRGVNEKKYNTEFRAEVELLYPIPVSDAINEMLSDKDDSNYNMKSHYLKVNMVMKKELAKIDKQIEELVS